MVKLMAVVEKLQQELFDVEKSRKEAETCASPCRKPSLTMQALIGEVCQQAEWTLIIDTRGEESTLTIFHPTCRVKALALTAVAVSFMRTLPCSPCQESAHPAGLHHVVRQLGLVQLCHCL